MDKLFTFSAILGIIMLVIGLILNYTINRRRFYRRSITGMQVYRSFEHSWITRWVEGIGKLVALGLIIFGILMILGTVIIPAKIK